MALNKEKVQDLIDDFVVSNVDQINEVATESPMVYDAVINALNLLSRKFGTIQAINIPKPAAPIEVEVPKANAINPIVQIGATFIDTKDHETKVEKINFEDEIVTFTRVDNQSPIKLKFSVVNDAIQRGDIKLKENPKANALNPYVKIGAKFKTSNTSIIIINAIDFDSEKVNVMSESTQINSDFPFKFINDKIESASWVPLTKKNTLNPLVKIGAEFIDGQNIIAINDIDFDNYNVTLIGGVIMGTADVTFQWINDKIEIGQLVPYVKPATQANDLNPKITLGTWFKDTSKSPPDDEFYVEEIDRIGKIVVTNWGNYKRDFTFVLANDMVEYGHWVYPEELNPLVDIDEIFEEKRSGNLISIKDIDYTKRKVQYDKEGLGVRDADFEQINGFIEDKEWVHKPSSKVIQSNTFGALTLNPSVQVGQKYIDLEDDSNFNVLLIDQKKQVVTINWNEDDIQGEVDFEDFNDNLQAATWVIAPDQAQVTATEDEILDAIEGLELIGDAVSKKEIAELKKQLKQLKKKKP
jgi:hypothetical protein